LGALSTHTGESTPAYTVFLEELDGGRVIREIEIGQRADGSRVIARRWPGRGSMPSTAQRVIRRADSGRVKTWDAAKLKATKNDWMPAAYAGPTFLEGSQGQSMRHTPLRPRGEKGRKPIDARRVEA
jgi:hypothetical protein